ENGILVCGHDHLGHGASAVTEEYLGYFAREKGWQYLIKDTVRLTKIIQEQYPAVPYFLVGHSMGSLIVRAIIPKYGYMYDGAALLGTLNSTPAMDAAYIYMKSLCRIKGEFYRPEETDRLLNIIGNSRFKVADSGFAWVSREGTAGDDYINDPLCNYSFTASAYADLIMLIMYASGSKWSESVDKIFPILICSGTEDYVGNWGKDALKLFDSLEKAGCEQVELKLYDGARHEILNETNREEVFADLLDWLNYHIYEVEE
ncbi:MAG: alpha/beta hydrolase, partial [Oscillospiraceae bacterium]|nr:alpha/beta hydrolase [Oscillospiraceae bacterium]